MGRRSGVKAALLSQHNKTVHTFKQATYFKHVQALATKDQCNFIQH